MKRDPQYYFSKPWMRKRLEVQARSKGICERCRIEHGEHVHHVTYDRFGRELLTDLLHVCTPCHGALHGGRKFIPVEQWKAKLQARRLRRLKNTKRKSRRGSGAIKSARKALARKAKEIDRQFNRRSAIVRRPGSPSAGNSTR